MLPRGARPIPGKFVLKCKPDKDGYIDKFKAGWVCQGFSQKYGIDYMETYAAVCSAVAIRILISVAVEMTLLIENTDVSSAFLTATLKETTRMFIKPPPGFTGPPGHYSKHSTALAKAVTDGLPTVMMNSSNSA